MMFGYDPRHPVPGTIRVLAFGALVYATADNNAALFWAALAVGIAAIILGAQQRKADDAEFERHLDQYVAGERDDLPGGFVPGGGDDDEL